MKKRSLAILILCLLLPCACADTSEMRSESMIPAAEAKTTAPTSVSEDFVTPETPAALQEASPTPHKSAAPTDAETEAPTSPAAGIMVDAFRFPFHFSSRLRDPAGRSFSPKRPVKNGALSLHYKYMP